MIFLHAYGSTRFAAPTCTAFAPAIIISMTSCALLTPPVMEFNIIAAPERLAEVGHTLGVPCDPNKTVYEQAYQAVEAFRALMRQLDLPLTLTELARALSVSPSHLSHTFSQRLHTSFRAYVNALRADHACTLLRSTDFSVTRIAYECGFETQRTFNRAFLEQCGETPSEYRRRARPELNDRFQR